MEAIKLDVVNSDLSLVQNISYVRIRNKPIFRIYKFPFLEHRNLPAFMYMDLSLPGKVRKTTYRPFSARHHVKMNFPGRYASAKLTKFGKYFKI